MVVAVIGLLSAWGVACINGYFGSKTTTAVKPPITFVGRVFDEANNPIAGATVLATQDQNPGQGIRTDAYGQFQIEVAPETKAMALVVSAVGFVTKPVQADIHRTGAEPIQLQRVSQAVSPAPAKPQQHTDHVTTMGNNSPWPARSFVPVSLLV